MLYYNRIDISEGIDPTKSNKSRENAWFVAIGFWIMVSNFKILILYSNISDIAIIIIKNVDYRIIHNISKSEAINLLKNSVLENRGYI